MALPTIQQVLEQARRRLAMHDSAQLDAEVLLACLLNKPRSHLLAWPEKQLDATQVETFDRWIERRANGEPVAHLTGEREFWSMPLAVTADTLIPRPDTETLVEQVLLRLPAEQQLRVADLGTGSGAIALALAKERPNWLLYAVDRSEACIELARRNAERLSLNNISFMVGNWVRQFSKGQLDAVVSNPPYVADDDPHLQEGDVRFEPRSALASGADGLDDIRQLVHEVRPVLARQGQLFLEHAPEQADEIAKLMKISGYSAIETRRDLAGRIRVSNARLPA